jgi:hypothetical protein
MVGSHISDFKCRVLFLNGWLITQEVYVSTQKGDIYYLRNNLKLNITPVTVLNATIFTCVKQTIISRE